MSFQSAMVSSGVGRRVLVPLGAASSNSGRTHEGTRLRRDLYRNIRTYKCLPAGARRYRDDMWKNVRTATLGTAAIAVWFAVVALGFGAQLWPLLEGVR